MDTFKHSNINHSGHYQHIIQLKIQVLVLAATQLSVEHWFQQLKDSKTAATTMLITTLKLAVLWTHTT